VGAMIRALHEKGFEELLVAYGGPVGRYQPEQDLGQSRVGCLAHAPSPLEQRARANLTKTGTPVPAAQAPILSRLDSKTYHCHIFKVDEVKYDLNELCRRGGVTARTVRFYIQQGLLPPPL